MKSKSANLSAQIKHAISQYRLILIAGPDLTQAEHYSHHVRDQFKGRGEWVDITVEQIGKDHRRLISLSQSVSLFGDREYPFLQLNGREMQAASQAIKAYLDNPDSNNDDFVLVLAPSAMAKRGLGKLIADHKKAFFMACYPLTEGQLAEYIKREGDKIGLHIAMEEARYIALLSNNDIGIATKEIEKLALYADATVENPQSITREAIALLAAPQEEDHFFDLMHASLSGDRVRLIHELRIFRNMGVSEVGLIRIMLGHLLKLYPLAIKINQSQRSVSDIVHESRLFFGANKQHAERQLRQWPAKHIAFLIDQLGEQEGIAKSGMTHAQTMFAQLLLNISSAATKR